MFSTATGIETGGKYRRIMTRIWHDPNFVQLSYHAQNCYMYVHTHPLMSSVGTLQANISSLADERSEYIPKRVFTSAAKELVDSGWLWVPYQKSISLIIEPMFLNQEPPINHNQIKAWGGIIRNIPPCEVLAVYLQNIILSADSFGEVLAESIRESLQESIEESFPKELREWLRVYRGTGEQGNIGTWDTPLLSPPNRAGQQKAAEKRRIVWTPETGWQGIEDGDVARWTSAYPACDIKRQLAAMDSWCRSNPKKAKKSNWPRFITNWLSSSQDRGGDLRGVKGINNDRRARAEAYVAEMPPARKITSLDEIDEIFGGKK